MSLTLPALAVAYRRFLPRSAPVWTLVALLSFALAFDPAIRNGRASCGASVITATEAP